MLGRLFGKNKDASDEPVCYQCGRTLLAGEWTQKVEGEDGEERLLCSLCGTARLATTGGGRPKAGNGAGAAADADDDAQGVGGSASGRGENEALWKAIKDRDAQIERLEEELARSEAAREELMGRLGRLEAGSQAPAGSQPAERPVDEEAHRLALEDTAAIPAAGLPDAGRAKLDEAAQPGEPESLDALPDESAAVEEDTAAGGAVEPGHEEAARAETEAPSVETAEAEGAAGVDGLETQGTSMTLLQRGVDLLNVSPVPRKIAETNTDLGIPTVHVGFDGETPTATFIWSMGWYRFAVDIETGGVRFADRGYDDRADLQPNATVRADGTVHLAAARISRAAAQRQHDEAPAAEAPAPRAGPAEAPPPATGDPDILSGSLLGQRTDDKPTSWERTQARDFDWD